MPGFFGFVMICQKDSIKVHQITFREVIVPIHIIQHFATKIQSTTSTGVMVHVVEASTSITM